MEFKYKLAHQKLNEECPPKNYEPKKIEAFRWVFDDLENSINFTPQYFKNPKRFLTHTDEKKCEAMSLSMWDSLENGRKAFNFLKNNVLGKKVFKILGTNIAQGTLDASCGVNSAIRKDGHFSHHQFKKTDYTQIFKLNEKL